MRTAVADTSLLAYDRLRESPRLSAQERKVMRALSTAPSVGLTRAEIAVRAGIRHSSACGRVRALLDAGLLIQEPRRRCNVTFESSHPLRLAPTQAELELVAA
ncbi:MAG TPA: hypothetical protein VN760_10805 [Casimicrobiaceae bacterium]|nr:hypothetical protein [Casimicrobiaceae bacterium]